MSQQFYTEGSDPLESSFVGISPAVSSVRTKKQLNFLGSAGNCKIRSNKQPAGNGFQGGSADGGAGNNNNPPHSPLTAKNPLSFTRRNFQKYQQHLESNIANISLANKNIIQEPLLHDHSSNKQNFQHMQHIASIYTPLSSKAINRRMVTPNNSSLKRRISSECCEEDITNAKKRPVIAQKLLSTNENSDFTKDSSINTRQSSQQPTTNTSQCNYREMSTETRGNASNNNNNNSLPWSNKINQAKSLKPLQQLSNQSTNGNAAPNRSGNRYIEKTQSDLPQIQTNLINYTNDRKNNVMSSLASQLPSTAMASSGQVPANQAGNFGKEQQPRSQTKDPNISQNVQIQGKGGSSRGSSLRQRASQLYSQPERVSANIFQDFAENNQNDPMCSAHFQIQINEANSFPQGEHSNQIQGSQQSQESEQQQVHNNSSKEQSKGRYNTNNKNSTNSNNNDYVDSSLPHSIINNIQNITIKNQQVNYNISTPTTSQTPNQMRYAFQQQNHHRGGNQNYSQNSRSIHQSSLGTRANSPFSKYPSTNAKLKGGKVNQSFGARGRIGGDFSMNPAAVGSRIGADRSPNNLNVSSNQKQANENLFGGRNLYIQTQPDSTEEEYIALPIDQSKKYKNNNISVRGNNNNNSNSSVSNYLQINSCAQSYLKDRHLTVHNDSEELNILPKKPQRYVNVSQPQRNQQQQTNQLKQIENIQTNYKNNSSNFMESSGNNNNNNNYEASQSFLHQRLADIKPIRRSKVNVQVSTPSQSLNKQQQISQDQKNLNKSVMSENYENSDIYNNESFNQSQQQLEDKTNQSQMNNESNQKEYESSSNQVLKQKQSIYQGDKSEKSQATTSASNVDNKSSSVVLEQSQQQQSKENNQKQSQQLQQQQQPKVKWDLSDEEWNTFGDRFPKTLLKKKLLGRGGFALVWLGEDKTTKDTYAIKQIQSRNSHQTHIKEIWFGSFFFKSGQPKEKYLKYRGIQNLSKLIQYDIKPIDTWIYYELCGKSLGSSLYELKGDGYNGEDRVYRVHKKKLYLEMQKNLKPFKKLVFELAQALWLLSDQRIVHSDLKTENILVKTNETKSSIEIDQVKLIDYGSSFTFGNLKHFSMATPEYMAPEILNFILYQNQLHHLPELLEYLKDYTKTYVIDIWSLGCVILEIISGIPLWMSLQTIVSQNGQEFIRQGLFAAKGRVFEQIIEKQIDVVNRIDKFIDECNYSGIVVDQELRYLLKNMLVLDPSRRISPRDVCKYLHMSVLGTEFVDVVIEDEPEKKNIEMKQ